MLYGPLYLPVVGLCSCLWSGIYWKNMEKFNALNVFCADQYPEKQATAGGEIAGPAGDLLVTVKTGIAI